MGYIRLDITKGFHMPLKRGMCVYQGKKGNLRCFCLSRSDFNFFFGRSSFRGACVELQKTMIRALNLVQERESE